MVELRLRLSLGLGLGLEVAEGRDAARQPPHNPFQKITCFVDILRLFILSLLFTLKHHGTLHPLAFWAD